MNAPDTVLELYRVDPSTGAFTKFDEISTYFGLNYYDVKNGIGGCSFSMSIYDPKATTDSLRRWRTIVVVKENDVIVWVGAITHIGANFEDVEGFVTIQCSSYMAYLTRRYTSSLDTHTNQDAGDIMVDLITATQNKTNGELGLVKGEDDTTITISDTYEYANIFDTIYDLTLRPGSFDFRIDYNVDANNQLDEVEYNILENIGELKDNLPALEIGVNVNKIISLDTQDDITNHITGLGQGTGENVLTKVEEDSGSQASYTRLEEIYARKDISLDDVLETVVEDRLNRNKIEKYHISLEMMPGRRPLYSELQLGDVIPINLAISRGGYIDFNGYATVVEAGKRIDDQGAKFTTYKLEFLL